MENQSNTPENKGSFSFLAGWRLLNDYEKKRAKKDIMAALNIQSKPGFYARRRGAYEPRVSEARAIEEVFKKYGVKPQDVWGK